MVIIVLEKEQPKSIENEFLEEVYRDFLRRAPLNWETELDNSIKNHLKSSTKSELSS